MRQFRLLLLILLSVLFGSLFIQPSPSMASIPQQQVVSDSTLIYYRLQQDGSDQCGDHPAITLGDFIKKTLPFEWIESWATTPNGIEALKAGAIAIRTYVLSAYNAGTVNIGGQNYRCVMAWSTRINFHSDESMSNIKQ